MRQRLIPFLLALLCALPARADWQGDKYSLFIHYGLYSIYGGVWDDKPVTSGYSEQILTFGIGFSDWYALVAREMYAQEFDADAIVRMAKANGMRSVVMTSKHHDGFCLFRTATTPYNTYDGTPARRDLLHELSEACHREGLGFGIYFSLIDWHFPGAVPFSSHNADPVTPSHHAYNMQQVRELLTGYGRVDELWFDMGSLLPEQSRELYQLVHSLQPACMVSGRLGNDYADFCVMADNEYPDYTMVLPWQTAASMFDETWGYRSWQERGNVRDKADEKLASLVRVVAGGGKYLLNIGPMGSGAIVPFEREVIETIGHYLAPIGEAIYNTHPSPFGYAGAGEMQATLSADRRSLYLFVPRGQQVVDHPALSQRPISLSLLNAKGTANLQCSSVWRYTLQVSTPEVELAPYVVVRATFADPVTYTQRSTSIGQLYAHSSADYYSGFRSIVGYEWNQATLPRTLLFTESEKGRDITLAVGGKSYDRTLIPTSSREVSTPLSKLRIGNFAEQRQRGLFGAMPTELPSAPSGSLLSAATSPLIEWEKDNLYERTGYLLTTALEADKAMELPIEISYREGLLVYLDGAYIAGELHRLSAPEERATMRLLLPLTRGRHTLTLKVYNRWGSLAAVSLRLLPSYTQHSMPLGLPAKERGPLRLTKRHELPYAAPARLSSLRLR